MWFLRALLSISNFLLQILSITFEFANLLKNSPVPSRTRKLFKRYDNATRIECTSQCNERLPNEGGKRCDHFVLYSRPKSSSTQREIQLYFHGLGVKKLQVLQGQGVPTFRKGWACASGGSGLPRAPVNVALFGLFPNYKQ